MTGRQPLIGLSAYCEEARWGYWQSPAVLLPANYGEQVAATGEQQPVEPVHGRGDIDPGRYGAQPHPRTIRVSAPRDAAELELLDAAMSAGLPVLGVCRGMQLVNVARGGTLCQHLADGAGHTPVPGTFGSHPVRVVPGTRLAGILGGNGDGVDVPTAHHQAVDRLGEGLVATAWTEDGVIEAVEPSAGGDPFLLAVQWHPEAGTDPRVIEALVAAASARMSLYTRQRD